MLRQIKLSSGFRNGIYDAINYDSETSIQKAIVDSIKALCKGLSKENSIILYGMEISWRGNGSEFRITEGAAITAHGTIVEMDDTGWITSPGISIGGPVYLNVTYVDDVSIQVNAMVGDSVDYPVKKQLITYGVGGGDYVHIYPDSTRSVANLEDIFSRAVDGVITSKDNAQKVVSPAPGASVLVSDVKGTRFISLLEGEVISRIGNEIVSSPKSNIKHGTTRIYLDEADNADMHPSGISTNQYVEFLNVEWAIKHHPYIVTCPVDPTKILSAISQEDGELVVMNLGSQVYDLTTPTYITKL